MIEERMKWLNNSFKADLKPRGAIIGAISKAFGACSRAA
jgi:hypothetical protein